VPTPSPGSPALAAVVTNAPTATPVAEKSKAQPKPQKISNKKVSPEPKPVATADASLVGKVLVYNDGGRFVVLNFPIGRLPMLEQRLAVYRAGQKVGEVKITGPQRDDNIVGDLSEGEVQPGDEVRER